MTKSGLPQFSLSAVDIIDKETLFAGFHTLVRYHLRHRLFQGGYSLPLQRECLLKKPAVAVLLIDPKQHKIVLVEQLRVGALDGLESPWMLEPVAGIIDEGQAEATAQRESLEEANCEIKHLIKIAEYLNSAGASNELTHLYCGLIDAPLEAGYFGLREEQEDIKTHLLDVEEAYRLRRAGHFKNPALLMALMWLELNYPFDPALTFSASSK